MEAEFIKHYESDGDLWYAGNESGEIVSGPHSKEELENIKPPTFVHVLMGINAHKRIRPIE